MSLATAELPNDLAALRAFAQACQQELRAAQNAVQVYSLEIEKLKFQIAKLRRMQFGRSSERITAKIEQLEFQPEELEAAQAEAAARAEAPDQPGEAAPPPAKSKPKRKPLPEHLPREDVVIEPANNGACTCPDCGGAMKHLGEDVQRVTRLCAGTFSRHPACSPEIRLRFVRRNHPAPASPMPTPRGRATPATLAHLLVSKYLDHLPIYRQCEIYAREGMTLDRSTLCDWVGPGGVAARSAGRGNPAACLCRHTEALILSVLARRPHPEQGFRTCIGILRLFRGLPADRAEAVSQRAVEVGVLSYDSVASILRHRLWLLPLRRHTSC